MEVQTIDRPLEIKSVSEAGHFSGYGAVFSNTDRDDDVIEPGAFRESLADHNKRGVLPPLLWQHNRQQPIGAFTKIVEDQKGLYVEGQIATKTSLGAEAYELMEMRAVTGLSRPVTAFQTLEGPGVLSELSCGRSHSSACPQIPRQWFHTSKVPWTAKPI